MKKFYIDFYTSLTYDGAVLVRYPLPCLALALLLVAQLLVAGITRTVPGPFRDAAAQIPDPTISSFTLAAPEIDGDIQDSEWAGAAKLDIVMSGSDSDIPGSIRVMNDENNLYIAFTIQDNSSLDSNILQLRFDDNHDGLLAPAENVFYYDPLTPTNFDSFMITVESLLELVGYDSSYGGTLDGEVAASKGPDSNNYEFSHPLCTSDDNFDFCLSPGSGVGILVLYGMPGDESAIWPGVQIGSLPQL